MNKWLLKLKEHPIYDTWNFEELLLSDKDIYANFIKDTEYEASVWSSNFTYLWAYNYSKNVYIFKTLVLNMLVTFILTKNGRLYLPCLPYGKGNVEKIVDVLLKCGKFCYEWNKDSDYTHKSIVNPINEAQLEFLKQSKRYEQYFREENLTGHEKHYSVPKLVKLYGKDFSKIRNKINKFNRTYPNKIVRSYKSTDFQQILELGEEWKETSGQKYRRIIDGFYFEPIIKHAKELNHLIIAVEIDDKIVGISTGELLPTGESWGCLTKFNKDYQGLSEFLSVEMCKLIHKLNPNVKTINVGSDLGREGLANFKNRFRPVLSYKRYAVFFNNNK